ncbi:MAG TPA: SHOCT domain-containing protein [Gaiellaceae bacterium]|nr:SHOCT domain-containing protein [Gaiellaceae bacterium]
MVGAIIQALIIGFVIGGLARWAVPGPDPMPIWMTTLFGLLGSMIGSGIAVSAFGRGIDSGTAFSAWLLSILAASLLVIAYRHFVQHRPITGPEAHKPPPGHDRQGRRATTFGSPPKRASEPKEVTEQLRKLGELRDEGVITPEDFERKKAELLARL